MRVTTVYLTCLASCIFGSACERDADEATDATATRTDGSFVDAEVRLDGGPGPADADGTQDGSADAAVIRDAADHRDAHPTRDAAFVDGAEAPDAITPEADVEPPADAAPPDQGMGTVARITLPSVQFICWRPAGSDEPLGWHLYLRLGYGEPQPDGSTCLDSDEPNERGEFVLVLEWNADLEESGSGTVVSGLYCEEDCEPVEGVVSFTRLDAGALRSRGNEGAPGPAPGPVASGRFEGRWVASGAPLAVPFHDAHGCLAVLFDFPCDGAP